jgi:hypothetical protein
MTEQKTHTDFDAASSERQWGGDLPTLAETLKHEAYELKGEWAWRILPRGALVAMCVPPTFRKQLRIARRLRKGLTDKTAQAWHAEVRVFLEQFGFADWKCVKDSIEPGDPVKIEAIYEEPVPLGGSKVHAEKCVRCGEPATKGVYAEALCTSCAGKAGQEEVNAQRTAPAE